MGNDGSLVSLECLQCNMSNLTLRLAHEHLTGSSQHLLVLALDFNLQTTRDEKKKAYVMVTTSSLILFG